MDKRRLYEEYHSAFFERSVFMEQFFKKNSYTYSFIDSDLSKIKELDNKVKKAFDDFINEIKK